MIFRIRRHFPWISGISTVSWVSVTVSSVPGQCTVLHQDKMVNRHWLLHRVASYIENDHRASDCDVLHLDRTSRPDRGDTLLPPARGFAAVISSKEHQHDAEDMEKQEGRACDELRKWMIPPSSGLQKVAASWWSSVPNPKTPHNHLGSLRHFGSPRSYESLHRRPSSPRTPHPCPVPPAQPLSDEQTLFPQFPPNFRLDPAYASASPHNNPDPLIPTPAIGPFLRSRKRIFSPRPPPRAASWKKIEERPASERSSPALPPPPAPLAKSRSRRTIPRVLLCSEEKRTMFVEQAFKYIGVPYRKGSEAAEGAVLGELYKVGLYLDCCGLVRRCLVDLCAQFGFMVGPWNQAYIFDTLPIKLIVEEMRPGDLVFVEGRYHDKGHRRPQHGIELLPTSATKSRLCLDEGAPADIVHVEIWTGKGSQGRGTIGARRQAYAVEEHKDFVFTSGKYEILAYHMRSIETWLGGVCRSYCRKHAWLRGRGASSENDDVGKECSAGCLKSEP